MTLRLLLLACVVALAMYLTAWAAMSPRMLADRLVDAFGPDAAVRLAQQGTASSIAAVWLSGLRTAMPFVAIGAAVGAVLRLWLGWWRGRQRNNGTITVTDRAGVAFTMIGAPFDHSPRLHLFAIDAAAARAAPKGSSPLEREALGAMAAIGTPADVVGAHGTSLLEHTRTVHAEAVKRFGAGSYEALGAVLHDLGKLLAYQRDEHGNWYQQHPRHDFLTTAALMRLPAYWALPTPERNRITLLVSMITTEQIPVDAPPELRRATVAARAADRRTTAAEKSAHAAQSGAIDMVVLCEALRELPAQLAGWNINGAARAAFPEDGWYLPDEDVVLLPDHKVRAWLQHRVDSVLAQQLGLDRPASGLHSANDPIAEACRLEHLIADAVGNVSAPTGWYQAAIGRERRAAVLALRAGSVASDVKSKWGAPRKEVRLAPAA